MAPVPWARSLTAELALELLNVLGRLRLDPDAALKSQLHEQGSGRSGADAVKDMMALLAPSETGKSALLEHLALASMPPEKEYNEQEALSNPDQLEAMRLARRACFGEDASYKESSIVCLAKPLMYTADNLGKRRLETRRTLQRVQDYKLNPSFRFQALGLLSPPGNGGSVGSSIPMGLASSTEFEVLAQMMTLDQLHGPLYDYLELEAAGEVEAYDDKHMHLARLWELLVKQGSSEADEARLYKQQGDKYNLPLKPWVRALAGKQFVVRSRTPDCKPDLVAELLFASDVMNLLLPSSTPDADMLFDEHQQALLEAMDKQDPAGPWQVLLTTQLATMKFDLAGQIRAVDDTRQTLLACMQQVTVFLPSQLLAPLHLVFLDSVGFDDANPTRLIRQRKLEEEVQSMVLLLPRDLSTMGPVIRHLESSPFTQRFVQAHTSAHPPAGPKPKLAIMVYTEKKGLRPPKGSDIGDTVDLPYMQQHGPYVKSALEACAAKSSTFLCTVFDRYLNAEAKDMQQAIDGSMLREQAEMLAAQVPLFYSLPMLGLTMLKALCSSPPPGLLPGVADPAQAMEKAIEATNLQAFMDLLAQPMVERCAGLLSDTLDTVMAAQEAPNRASVLEKHAWMRRLARNQELVKQLQDSATKGKRFENCRERLEMQVGHTSQFSREFHERLNMKLWTEFEERMEKLVDAQLETAVRDIMQRVCNRLVSKFCGPAPRKGNLLRLGSVLRSSTQWRHPEAPLHTWLDAELTKRVDLGFLLKELQELLPKLEGEVVGLMVDTVQRLVVPQDAGITDDMVKEVLLGSFRLTELVRDRFRKAFNSRNSALSQYKALLQREVLRDFSNSKQRCSLSRKLSAIDTASPVAVLREQTISALEDWFGSRVTGLLGNIKVSLLRQGQHPGLLAKQWQDAKRRIHEAAYNEEHNVRQQTPMSQSLLIPIFRAFGKVMAQELNAAAARKEAEALINKAEETKKLLAMPLQLLDSHPPYIKRLLRGPMQAVQQLTRRSAVQRVVCTRPAAPVLPSGSHSHSRSQSNSQTRSQTRSQAVASAGQGPAGLGEADWAGRGPHASAEQMVHFRRYLASQGLRVEPTPGDSNNCGYRAILHQLHGVPLGAGDEAAAAAAGLHREMVADVLEALTVEELAQAEERGQQRGLGGPDRSAYNWVAAIEAVQLGQHAEGDVRATVAAHLAGVRGNEPSTHIELAALGKLLGLEDSGVALLLYSPLYGEKVGYHVCLTATQPGPGRPVLRVALGPLGEGGGLGPAGELVHYVALHKEPTTPMQQRLASPEPAASKVVSGRGSSLGSGPNPKRFKVQR